MARPAILKDARQYNLYVGSDLKAELERAAKLLGVKPSEFVRAAISEKAAGVLHKDIKPAT